MKETYLSRRHEFKYLLDPVKAQEVESFFNGIGLSGDENGLEHGFYAVSSLYFDTPHFDDFYAKEAGLLRRKKLRARMYNPTFDPDAGPVWLELKKKHDMAIAKERIRLTREEWQRLIEGDTFFMLSPLRDAGTSEHRALREFMYFYLSQQYKPTVAVTYLRKPYMDRFLSSVRVTLDKEIVAMRVDGFDPVGSMVPVFPHSTVLEVKFKEKMPWWFEWMVGKFDLKRQSFSKYTRSVDAVREPLGIKLLR